MIETRMSAWLNRIRYIVLSILCLLTVQGLSAAEIEDIEKVPADLVTPEVTDGEPAPGKRVRQVNKGYTGAHHLVYLPTDWVAGKKYPVIVEYAGNKFPKGAGTVESSNLGYGISGGKGVIWICMPFVHKKRKRNVVTWRNAVTWWGDVRTTVAYCKTTVKRICDAYGGDPSNLFIAGFSRGSIACNFIGLYDDEIASLWRGFICHSYYDGSRRKSWPGTTCQESLERLKRLKSRPQFISHERPHVLKETRAYLAKNMPNGNFTFQQMSFPNHTDCWVLRDIPERKAVRDWFNKALSK